MKNILSLIIISFLLILANGCQKLFLGEPVPNTVLGNYDTFVQDFQEKYGLFAVKPFQWDSLTQAYRETLAADPTEAQLYESLTGLVDNLNDSHVFLYVPERKYPFFGGGIYGRLERQEFVDFDFNLVLDKYVDLTDSVESNMYYGKIGQDIGYIYIDGMPDYFSFYDDNLPGILEGFKDTKGLIIDIRDNNGGEDEGSRKMAGYFTNTSIPYMTSRYKIGPGANDFESPRTWTVEPSTNEPYIKPIVLLTNRYSISASETFSLAMKELPQTIQIGDTTTGAFSDVVTRQLPNGWLYGVSVGDYRDANNVSYEDIGLAPDILVENNETEIKNGLDKALEKAIEELRK